MDTLFPLAKGLFPENEDPVFSGETETGAGKPEAAAPDMAELAELGPGGEADTPGDEPETARAGADGEPPAARELTEDRDPAEDGELTGDGRRSGGGGVTEDEAGSTITDGSGRVTGPEPTTAVPRAARRGPINRAARLNTLRVAVS
ncbi:hypothetical protein GCM10022629_19760 [Amorphoplanes auranticolor]